MSVDATYKWLEVEMVDTATSASTIEKLRKIFATHGIPKSIVSNNGFVFTSEEIITIHYIPLPNSTHHEIEMVYKIYVQTFKKKTMQKLSIGTLQNKY